MRLRISATAARFAAHLLFWLSGSGVGPRPLRFRLAAGRKVVLMEMASPQSVADASTPPTEASGKPPISERKRAANRANAAKSTGPRTAAGKRRSKRNAFRHGAFADCAFLPGDDPRELINMYTEFHVEFGEESSLERTLAGRVMAVLWKLRRLARAEEIIVRDARIQAGSAYIRVHGLTADEEIDLDKVGPSGAEALADDFVAGGTAGRMQQLTNAEIRLTGQLTSLSRLLFKARQNGSNGSRRFAGRTPELVPDLDPAEYLPEEALESDATEIAEPPKTQAAPVPDAEAGREPNPEPAQVGNHASADEREPDFEMTPAPELASAALATPTVSSRESGASGPPSAETPPIISLVRNEATVAAIPQAEAAERNASPRYGTGAALLHPSIFRPPQLRVEKGT